MQKDDLKSYIVNAAFGAALATIAILTGGFVATGTASNELGAAAFLVTSALLVLSTYLCDKTNQTNELLKELVKSSSVGKEPDTNAEIKTGN